MQADPAVRGRQTQAVFRDRRQDHIQKLGNPFLAAVVVLHHALDLILEIGAHLGRPLEPLVEHPRQAESGFRIAARIHTIPPFL